MKNVICIYKPVAKTPLECIDAFKKAYPEYKDKTISYAGRLDPMAEGLLLLLVGDENKKRQQYEGLTKTYEFDILFGVTTDTYDMLGKITSSIENCTLKIENLQSVLQQFVGRQLQPYPPYSSKAVQGKPLYWWARNNKLDEITIPKKQITITKLDLLTTKNISIDDLRDMIQDKITKMQGDFRQQEILEDWRTFFDTCHPELDSGSLPVITCIVTCSSGTYVRSIAHELGKKLGCGAIALRILRTHVGEYRIEDAIVNV